MKAKAEETMTPESAKIAPANSAREAAAACAEAAAATAAFAAPLAVEGNMAVKFPAVSDSGTPPAEPSAHPATAMLALKCTSTTMPAASCSKASQASQGCRAPVQM